MVACFMCRRFILGLEIGTNKGINLDPDTYYEGNVFGSDLRCGCGVVCLLHLTLSMLWSCLKTRLLAQGKTDLTFWYSHCLVSPPQSWIRKRWTTVLCRTASSDAASEVKIDMPSLTCCCRCSAASSSCWRFRSSRSSKTAWEAAA